MNNRPIGVFDSGVGGLTVLKNLCESLPQENFIYVGDNLHSPYGEKSAAELLEYTSDILDFFAKNECKLVVLACNTTSCTVLDSLREKYPYLPMIGVIDATVDMVKKHDPKKVAVMATKATIQSQAYQKQLGKDKTVGVACPSLVPLIESGADTCLIKKEIHGYLDEMMKECDSIILGCTHYPIITSEIQQIYPMANLYSSSEAVVFEVASYLEKHDLSANKKKKEDVIYTTGDLDTFIRSSSTFFHYEDFKVLKLTLKVA